MEIRYRFERKTYKIVITDEGDRNEHRAQQIYDDFKYCESIGDWQTIKNRIQGGLRWGWIVEIDDTTIPEPTKENNKFW